MRSVPILVLLGACTGASPDPGLTRQLQVQGGQLRPGPFPADAGGPATVALTTTHTMVVVDRVDEQVTGTLEPLAHAAAIGIAGADDAWIVVAGTPAADTPGFPAAKARFSLSPEFPPGPFTLVMAAADRDGRFGPPATVDLVAEALEPPPGELVIGLEWDGAADLDLHVVDPLGGEAWSDDPNTFDPPPGTAVDPAEFKNFGILDHDGNMDCHREGHPAEHVTWVAARCSPDPCRPPPSGGYIVRVDAPSLCGDASAPWFVTVLGKQADGSMQLLGSARGIATPDDVLQTRGRGAGVLALRFALP